MADAEGVIGELKNHGTAYRAQRRGTPHFHVQLLLNCTAVNCKRLSDYAPQAQSGVATAPQTAEARRSVEAASAAVAQHPTAAVDRSRWLAAVLRRGALRLRLRDLAQLSHTAVLKVPSWTGP